MNCMNISVNFWHKFNLKRGAALVHCHPRLSKRVRRVKRVCVYVCTVQYRRKILLPSMNGFCAALNSVFLLVLFSLSLSFSLSFSLFFITHRRMNVLPLSLQPFDIHIVHTYVRVCLCMYVFVFVRVEASLFTPHFFVRRKRHKQYVYRSI